MSGGATPLPRHADPSRSFGVEPTHRSDQAHSRRAGSPALMWADTAGFRNSDDHPPSDTPEPLDSDFLAEVTRPLIHPVLSGVGEAGR